MKTFIRMMSYYIYVIMTNLKFTRAILMIYILNQGVSIVEFSIIQIVFNLVKILSNFPTGVISDYIKRKQSIAIGATLNGIVFLIIYLISLYNVNNHFWLFMILFSLNAIGTSFMMESDQALLYDYLVKNGRKDDYVKIFSRKEVLATAFLTLGTVITGYVSEISLAIPFLMQAVTFFIASYAILSFPEEKKPSEDSRRPKILEIAIHGIQYVRNSSKIIMLIVFLALVVASTDGVVMFTQGYFDDIGMSMKLIGYIYSGSTLLSMLASLLSQKVNQLKLVNIVSLVFGLFVVGIGMLMTHNYWIISIGFLIVYITIDLIEPPILGLLNNEVPNEIRTTILSLLGTIRNAIAMALYLVYGVVSQVSGYHSMYLVLGLIIFVSFIGIYYYYFRFVNCSNKII
ncbi:MAG: MFS transporter [Clostridiaceae bacterium]|nr:MFS transporter [Clostridiaceae bacterium]